MTRTVSSSYEAVYATVSRIPAGRVSTYGRVAKALGRPNGARQVGYALAALPAARADVPWHRVVNAEGRISRRADPDGGGLQRRLLQDEGVRFDASGCIDLDRYLWREAGDWPGPGRPGPTAAG